ncbi:hypothetical protein CPC08DRAFT_712546 [Agrocybe pediades]|nr:hypothetical protein CPC08DRAFT_712546 [Agrocybe pediades]
MSLNSTTSLLDIPNSLPVKATFDTRTSWDIIRSCVATLFACLWVSVHPNMSPPGHSDIRVFFAKVELMIWTLLFPEWIILWAFRQWLGARAVSKEFKDYEWTMSHGFFVQMGGFVETGVVGYTRVLLPDDLFSWMSKHERVPKVTTQQISRRSKGDGFSKAIVIAQTSWFVAQCIGRHVKGLFITSAELSTLAYAILNGVMYLLWWHKPLDCQTPVELRYSYTDYPNDAFYSYNGSQVSVDQGPMFYAYAASKSPTDNFRVFREDSFWGHILLVLVCLIFGSVHVLAWFSDFPSRSEHLLWRICSVAITVLPIIYALPNLLLRAVLPPEEGCGGFTGDISLLLRLTRFIRFTGLAIPPLYLIARLFLLIEIMISFRNLPSSAFVNVSWTAYFPHV